MGWFTKELQELQQSGHVNLMIYVTRDDVSEAVSSLKTVQGTEIEKGKEEKNGGAPHTFDLRKGRPDIADLVTDCLSRCSLEDRIGVGACGPFHLSESAREAVCRKDYDDGPSITFHCEVSDFFGTFCSFHVPTDNRHRNSNGEMELGCDSTNVTGMML